MNLARKERTNIFYELHHSELVCRLAKYSDNFSIATFAVAVAPTMKKQAQEEKCTEMSTDRFRSLCSMSGLLLSVVCCIALIHVELRIQEHHRLISHSVTICDQLETQILRKVKENYGRWQDDKGSHSQGHWRETKGKIRSCHWHFKNILRSHSTGILVYL